MWNLKKTKFIEAEIKPVIARGGAQSGGRGGQDCGGMSKGGQKGQTSSYRF